MSGLPVIVVVGCALRPLVGTVGGPASAVRTGVRRPPSGGAPDWRAAFAVTAVTAMGMLGAGACDRSGAAGAEGKPGELRVVAGEHGFVPAALSLARGAPGSKATVTFVRTTDKTCATEVVFPALDVKKDLPLNQPVAVEIPTESARSLTFQCGMGMYKGALVVN